MTAASREELALEGVAILRRQGLKTIGNGVAQTIAEERRYRDAVQRAAAVLRATLDGPDDGRRQYALEDVAEILEGALK